MRIPPEPCHSFFFHAHLASAGLRFVNADVLAAELAVGPYEAARLADALRRALVERGESFVFELPHVLIDDNSDLDLPYRQVAVFDRGQPRHLQDPIPEWLRLALPRG